MTPLYSAIKNGHLHIVKFLIREGAILQISKPDGVTPLLFACQNGFLDIMKILVENGANIHEKSSNVKKTISTQHLFIMLQLVVITTL